MDYALYILFVVVSLINTVHLGLYIGGANLYDLRRFKGAAGQKKRGLRPLVSVVVPAHNEELVIERCLDSIRKSSHRKLEVIVHNDRSTDKTRKIVEAYKKAHPSFSLRLVNRRKQVGKAGGVNYCIKQHARGELIMTLDADCVLHKDAVKHAVAYFDDPIVVGVAANVRLIEKPTILGILQQFEHLIGYRSKKFYTVANCEFIVGGVASTYRRRTLKEAGYYDTDTMTEDIGLSMKIVALGNRTRKIVYGVDVVAMTEGAHSYKALFKQRYRWKMGCLQNLVRHTALVGRRTPEHTRSLTWYRLPMAFLSEAILFAQPFILGYVFYLSFQYHTLMLFIGAYLTITGYVLLTIWPDEHSTLKGKLTMSAYAPLLYFTFYIMDTIQVISIARCLINPRQVLRRTANQGTWVSPERAGQRVQFS
jgi:biofilm PGA synthesis N-glycosyltransferase PgaC